MAHHEPPSSAAAPSHTFLWHDYETFGRLPKRDRPAQFAAIRTDAALNEIGEPVMMYCQPPRDMLPDPESCLLTGILPQLCAERGLPEFRFAADVEALLARPGTIGLGYNTIRFDDEVTRHLFWRNLIDPYGREWQNECCRWDLVDTVRCAYALRPDGIEWPRHEDGRPSFKLEHLSRANGLMHDAAHDALSDVRATIGLARLIREKQPRLFEFCFSLRRKDAVWQQIGTDRPFLHISGMYGVERGGVAMVWPLAPHPTHKNELIVWDLAEDPSILATLTTDDIRLRMFSKSDQLPEGVARLPIKTIHVNKSPVVIGNLATLSDERAVRWGLDRAQCLAHADRARDLSQALSGVWPEVFKRPAPPEAPDVDEDLYGGFVSPADRRTLERLRGLAPDLLAAQRPAFEDGRLDELLFRYRARNFGSTLTDEESARWQAHCHARLHEGRGGLTTLVAFFEQIDVLNETADERGQELLGHLYDWAEALA